MYKKSSDWITEEPLSLEVAWITPEIGKRGEGWINAVTQASGKGHPRLNREITVCDGLAIGRLENNKILIEYDVDVKKGTEPIYLQVPDPRDIAPFDLDVGLMHAGIYQEEGSEMRGIWFLAANSEIDTYLSGKPLVAGGGNRVVKEGTYRPKRNSTHPSALRHGDIITLGPKRQVSFSIK